MLLNFFIFNLELYEIDKGKALISNINAYCYNMCQIDEVYQKALLNITAYLLRSSKIF